MKSHSQTFCPICKGSVPDVQKIYIPTSNQHCISTSEEQLSEYKLFLETAESQIEYIEYMHRLTRLTTIVLMGYQAKRKSNYETIFNAYSKMESVLDQVVFIWNNDIVHPPHVPQQTNVPIRLLLSHSNHMYNRFNVCHVVKTPSMLVVDDDVLLSEYIIASMLRTYTRYPQSMIGLDYRSFDASGNYLTKRSTPERTLVIGKTMLFGVQYAEAFINNNLLLTASNPCEDSDDLAMSFLIRAKGHPPIVLSARKRDRTYLNDVDGLSNTRKWSKWMKDRSQCVRWVQGVFNLQKGSINYYTKRNPSVKSMEQTSV